MYFSLIIGRAVITINPKQFLVSRKTLLREVSNFQSGRVSLPESLIKFLKNETEV